MMDILYLAWRYLARHPAKTVILVTSVTLVLYTPFGLRTLVRTSREQLRERAISTPLLIGASGSQLELTLNSLYFRAKEPPPLAYGEVAVVRESGLGEALPLHVRFQVGELPIVGTSLDYFEFRGLRPAEGRLFGQLGECVLGAAAARELGRHPGESVMSSPESVFDLAGVYPLKMEVAGVLEPTGLPDDRAVFVDVKTAWVIEGLAHGHADLNDPTAAAGVLRKEEGQIIANRSVVEFNEITPENINSFHFHGDPDRSPLTGLIVVPRDQKGAALLMGRYGAGDHAVQIFRPREVMDELFATVFRVEGFVVAAFAVIGSAALATAALVFLLSLRLRQREFLTLRRIGAEPVRLAALRCSEIISVLLVSALLAFLLNQATGQISPRVVAWLLERA